MSSESLEGRGGSLSRPVGAHVLRGRIIGVLGPVAASVAALAVSRVVLGEVWRDGWIAGGSGGIWTTLEIETAFGPHAAASDGLHVLPLPLKLAAGLLAGRMPSEQVWNLLLLTGLLLGFFAVFRASRKSGASFALSLGVALLCTWSPVLSGGLERGGLAYLNTAFYLFLLLSLFSERKGLLHLVAVAGISVLVAWIYPPGSVLLLLAVLFLSVSKGPSPARLASAVGIVVGVAAAVLDTLNLPGGLPEPTTMEFKNIFSLPWNSGPGLGLAGTCLAVLAIYGLARNVSTRGKAWTLIVLALAAMALACGPWVVWNDSPLPVAGGLVPLPAWPFHAMLKGIYAWAPMMGLLQATLAVAFILAPSWNRPLASWGLLLVAAVEPILVGKVGGADVARLPDERLGVAMSVADGPVLHLPLELLHNDDKMGAPPGYNALWTLVDMRLGRQAAVPWVPVAVHPLLAEPLVVLSLYAEQVELPGSERIAIPNMAPGLALKASGVHWLVVHRGLMKSETLEMLDPVLLRTLGPPVRDLVDRLDIYEVDGQRLNIPRNTRLLAQSEAPRPNWTTLDRYRAELDNGLGLRSREFQGQRPGISPGSGARNNPD